MDPMNRLLKIALRVDGGKLSELTQLSSPGAVPALISAPELGKLYISFTDSAGENELFASRDCPGRPEISQMIIRRRFYGPQQSQAHLQRVDPWSQS